jgi:AcrR family transcriptional regulator
MSLTAIDVDNPNCAKDRILLAAGRIFSEKGFRCSTVREICDAAEVNIASVNYYFGDKKKLYAETLLLAREIGAQKFPIPDLSVLATSEDRLRSIILLLLNRLVGTHDEPWPVKILMSEILNPSPAAKPLIDGYIQPFLKMVFATVKEMVDDSVSDSTIHQLSFSVVSQCVWYRFAGDINRMVIDEEEFNDNFAINHLAKQILDFSLAGISAVGSNSSGRISTSTMAEKAHPIKRPKKPTDARAVVESATSPV